MDSPAFAVNGMFSAVKVGNSSFTANNVVTKSTNADAKPAPVTMKVDAFQRKFQSIGKIGIDYARPKKLASFKRSGYSTGLDFPNSKTFAGFYSLTDCGRPGGATKIMMKYDEYCAKSMVTTYKKAGAPYGEYVPMCTEGTVPFQAFDTRVFNRTQAFRQSQKPVNIRLREKYEARKACFSLAHNCSREEEQFKQMPMSCATYLSGKMESMGTCYRTVRPTTKEEDYMSGSVRSQLYQKINPSGVYAVGICEDGYSKGEAETRRVIALASEYRAAQQSPSTVTRQQYDSAKMARQLFTHECHHEEVQVSDYPAVAAALCKY